MTTTDAYAQFLTARWDEIEQVERESDPVGWVTFRNADGSMHHTALGAWTEEGWVVDGRMIQDDSATADVHDPAYALADLAAKRAILDLHKPQRGECSTCFDPDTAAGDYDFQTWPCPTVAALAEPFRDHPDHPDNQEA